MVFEKNSGDGQIREKVQVTAAATTTAPTTTSTATTTTTTTPCPEYWDEPHTTYVNLGAELNLKSAIKNDIPEFFEKLTSDSSLCNPCGGTIIAKRKMLDCNKNQVFTDSGGSSKPIEESQYYECPVSEKFVDSESECIEKDECSCVVTKTRDYECPILDDEVEEITLEKTAHWGEFTFEIVKNDNLPSEDVYQSSEELVGGNKIRVNCPVCGGIIQATRKLLCGTNDPTFTQEIRCPRTENCSIMEISGSGEFDDYEDADWLVQMDFPSKNSEKATPKTELNAELTTTTPETSTGTTTVTNSIQATKNPDFTDYMVSHLNEHNYYRSLHGAPSLKLNKTLNSFAQKWADELIKTGNFQHDPENRVAQTGENLYSGWRSPFGPAPDSSKDSVKAWYDEIEFYSYADSEREIAAKFSKIGHFTQLIWDDTTDIGVAVASKKDESNGMITTVVVTKYWPAGNMMNAMKKHVYPLVGEGGVTTTKMPETTTTKKVVDEWKSLGDESDEGEWKTQKFTFTNNNFGDTNSDKNVIFSGGFEQDLLKQFPSIQTDNPEMIELLRNNFMTFLKSGMKKDDNGNLLTTESTPDYWVSMGQPLTQP
jgi:uncharacterized protein YkwD